MGIYSVAPLFSLLENNAVQTKMQEAARVIFTSDTFTVNLAPALAAGFFVALVPLLAFLLLPKAPQVSSEHAAPHQSYGVPHSSYEAPDDSYSASHDSYEPPPGDHHDSYSNSQDSYGAPLGDPQDSYGAPLGDPHDSYGAPFEDPHDVYHPPNYRSDTELEEFQSSYRSLESPSVISPKFSFLPDSLG